MSSVLKITLSRAAAGLAGALVMASGSSFAQAQSVLGIWIDHTGRGAVEITECGNAVCGKVVWVKDAKHAKTCGNPVLGNVRAVGGNIWDRGWIIDPDDNARYSVELKPIGSDRLRVVGYMGSKLFSETMTWKRAPADLVRCDGKSVQEARVEPPAAIKSAPAPAAPPPTAVAPTVPQAAAAPPAPEVSPAPDSAKPTVTVLPPTPRPTKSETSPARVPAIAQPPAEPPAPRTATAPASAPDADNPPDAAQSPAPAPAARPRVAAAPDTSSEGPAPRKRKAAKSCKLDLPYITLNYPCDAF